MTTRGASLFKRIIPLAAAVILAGWLNFAPAGLMGKADAVGYAVCHRIDARSFHLGERELPLCARCTGMYLGVLVGMGFQRLTGRRGSFPGRGWMVFYAVLALIFTVDGLNSYLSFFPMGSPLYQPNNIFRLVSGTGMGLAVAGFVLPAFYQTVYARYEDAPAFTSWRQGIMLLGAAGLVDAAVLTENTLLLYPLALASAAGVVILLGMVYTMVWTMLTRTENHFAGLRQAWPVAAAGLGTTVLQILLVDAIRLAATGTWMGFSL